MSGYTRAIVPEESQFPADTVANIGSPRHIIQADLEAQIRNIGCRYPQNQQAALNQTGTATRHQKARRVIATSGDDFRYNRTRPLPPGYKAINGLGELHERPRQLATLKT
jgi:hypothetical protein